jgi:hypothetical protein
MEPGSDGLRAAPVVAQIVKYYKETIGMELKLLRPLSGSPARLRSVSTLESIDAFQAQQDKARQDPAFHKLLSELSPFVDGSKTCDEIWQ